MTTKLLAAVFFAVFSSTTFAGVSKEDLELKNGLYLRNFAKYTCNSFSDEAIAEPSFDFKSIEAEVGELLVDRKLNNALLKVTFKANGVECRYSVISERSRETVTLNLTKSKVFAVSGKDSDCETGRKFLDTALKTVGYEASDGRHEFIALLVKTPETEKTCVSSNGTMRLVFDKNRER